MSDDRLCELPNSDIVFLTTGGTQNISGIKTFRANSVPDLSFYVSDDNDQPIRVSLRMMYKEHKEMKEMLIEMTKTLARLRDERITRCLMKGFKQRFPHPYLWIVSIVSEYEKG